MSEEDAIRPQVELRAVDPDPVSGAEAILACLGSRAGDTSIAWGALRSLLARLARRPLFEPRTRKSYIIPEEHREDMVQEVATKIWRMGGLLPVVGKSDGECVSYLCTMLVRFWIGHLRKTGAETAVDPTIQDNRGSRHRTAPASHGLDGGVFASLDRLCEEYREARPKRYQEAVTRTWREIEELISSPVTLELIIERDYGIVRSHDPEGFKLQRDSVLQAHSRLRKGLFDLIQTKCRTGVLAQEDEQSLEKALQSLFRCQKARQSGVP